MRTPFLLAVFALLNGLACTSADNGGNGDAGVTGNGGTTGGSGGSTSSGGSGGISSTGGNAGTNPSGGMTSLGGGGSASGGAGGDGMVCCNAFPVCPTGEHTANTTECPGEPSCHEISICCSTIWCVSNDGSGGTGDGGSAGDAGATHDCNGTPCGATQACIAYRTEGGAISLPDAGTCPTGQHLEGSFCQRDFAYKCADLQGRCQNQPVTCSCAEPQNNAGTCPMGYGSCSEPGANVDSSAQLVCQQLVP